MNKKTIFLLIFIILVSSFIFFKKNDREANLNLFYNWNKNDPLFFSSTIDIEKTEESIDLLKNEEDLQIKERDLPGNIFPISFLNQYLEASRSFKELKKEKTYENAQALVNKIKKAQRAYEKDLSNFEAIIIDLAKKSNPKEKIAYLGGETYTTLDDAIDHLNKMKENSGLVAEEIKQREECLTGSKKHCKTDFSKNLVQNFQFDDTEPDISSFSREFLNIPSETILDGPYKTISGCWREPFERYFYIAQDCIENRDYCMEVQYLANKKYFGQVPKAESFKEAFEEKGVKLFPQRATAPYACNDHSYKTDISSLNYIVKTSEQNIFQSLPKEIKNEKDIQNGFRIEEGFFGQESYAAQEMEVLADYYFDLFQRKDVSDKIRKEALRRYSTWNEKMINFDQLVNNATFHLESYRKYLKVSGLNSSNKYIYLARSNYPFFYLNFSNTVWRLGEDIEYHKIGKRPEEPIGIYTYDEVIKEYGEEKIEEWLDVYYRLESRYLIYDKEFEEIYKE